MGGDKRRIPCTRSTIMFMIRKPYKTHAYAWNARNARDARACAVITRSAPQHQQPSHQHASHPHKVSLLSSSLLSSLFILLFIVTIPLFIHKIIPTAPLISLYRLLFRCTNICPLVSPKWTYPVYPHHHPILHSPLLYIPLLSLSAPFSFFILL